MKSLLDVHLISCWDILLVVQNHVFVGDQLNKILADLHSKAPNASFR